MFYGHISPTYEGDVAVSYCGLVLKPSVKNKNSADGMAVALESYFTRKIVMFAICS